MTQESDWIAPLEGISLGKALRNASARYGDMECFCDGNKRLTFAQFNHAVDQLVIMLARQGIGPQDHVSVWVGNSLEWALLFFACGRLGAVMVPINTRYTASEVEYILRHSDSRLLVMQTSAYRKDYVELLLEIAPQLRHQQTSSLNLSSLPKLQAVMAFGEGVPAFATDFNAMWDLEVDDALVMELEDRVDPLKPLIICYTSGTTGHPKGVMHNHRVMKQAVRVGLALDLKPGGRILGHMPLYHVAGLYMALVPALLMGACFVNMRQWSPEDALDLIESEKITTIGGIPTHFVDLCNDPALERRDLSTLENAWIGGAPVMRSTFERFREKLGIRQLMSTYGMTENTISTTFNRLDDPVEICCSNKAPVLGPSEIRIIDVDSGQTCAPGVIGEILCRGETVMMGYYKNEEATRQSMLADGWLRTGDLGCFDEHGYLHVTGRLKDMYKSGGINVYPSEVEQHLVRHPDIRMVSIVGVADERLGEVGFAFVQCHEGKTLTIEDIRDFCKGSLASYKVPFYMQLVDEIPRTNTGKVEKRTLNRMADDFLESIKA